MTQHKTAIFAALPTFCTLAIGLLAAAPSNAAGSSTCFTLPEPVISLSFGSRYEATSKSRSDLDEESDAAVTKALKPVDAFIRNLAKQVTKAAAASDTDTRTDNNRCVINAVYAWASADALSDMRTANAKISVPSRVGGIAIAYAESRNDVSGMSAEERVIEQWLVKRARETVEFFDNEATAGASRNNLRAWASLAVGQIGIIAADEALVNWATLSNASMIAGSADDGSLPLEMKRLKYALHYQLHAMTPLVTSVAQLCDAGYGEGGADMKRLSTMASFSINAVKDPTIVQKITGVEQTVEAGLEANAGMLAWLEPYVALSGENALESEFSAFRPLSNSKLGGNVTQIYGGRRINCTITAIR